MRAPQGGPEDYRIAEMRLVESVAHGLGETVVAGEGRIIEFSVRELERLLWLLGFEGMVAYTAYLKVLHHELGTDGKPILVVDDFSGRWLQANTELGRNAAYRAQNALESAGLFGRIVSRSGQGARGLKRAILNPDLVVIPGGADGDVSSLRVGKPGRPLSQRAGKRETGAPLPVSSRVGNRGTGPVSQFPGGRESGTPELVSAQVRAGFPAGSVEAGTAFTSSEPLGVDQQLLSDDAGMGLLQRVLAPAMRQHPDLVTERLYVVFNAARVADNSEPLAVCLRLDGQRNQRARRLAEYVAEVLVGDLDPATELVKLKVRGKPALSPDMLAERIVVGLVVGLGLPKVGAWGAWMHTVTRQEWTPTGKTNAVLAQFISVVERFAAEQRKHREQIAQAGDLEVSPEGQLRVPADPSNRAARQAQPASSATEGDGVPEAISADVVAEHFAAARAVFPHFCREGTPAATDPVRRERLVRLYLQASAEAAADGPGERPATSSGHARKFVGGSGPGGGSDR